MCVFVYPAARASLIVFTGLIRRKVNRRTPNLTIKADLSRREIYLNISGELKELCYSCISWV
jgi:hypothetical protein